jgi:hypothetical protein
MLGTLTLGTDVQTALPALGDDFEPPPWLRGRCAEPCQERQALIVPVGTV